MIKIFCETTFGFNFISCRTVFIQSLLKYIILIPQFIGLLGKGFSNCTLTSTLRSVYLKDYRFYGKCGPLSLQLTNPVGYVNDPSSLPDRLVSDTVPQRNAEDSPLYSMLYGFKLVEKLDKDGNNFVQLTAFTTSREKYFANKSYNIKQYFSFSNTKLKKYFVTISILTTNHNIYFCLPFSNTKYVELRSKKCLNELC